jgi:hypothetical protein
VGEGSWRAACSTRVSAASLEREGARRGDREGSNASGGIAVRGATARWYGAKPRPTRRRLAHAAGWTWRGGVAQQRAHAGGMHSAPCRARQVSNCGTNACAPCHGNPIAWRRARESSRACRHALLRHLLATAGPGHGKPPEQPWRQSVSSPDVDGVKAHPFRPAQPRCGATALPTHGGADGPPGAPAPGRREPKRGPRSY